MARLDADADIGRCALTGEYMDLFNATYYVLEHAYTNQVVHQIFGEDVRLHIDWTYTLDYLKGDRGTVALVDAADAMRGYLSADAALQQARVTRPGWTELNALLTEAGAQLGGAQRLLAARSTDEMEQAAEAIRETQEALAALVEDIG